jgi:hypothetical protein
MPPVERAAVLASLRKNSAIHQMVGGDVQERFVERALSALASVDLPELDAPFRKMIRPGPLAAGTGSVAPASVGIR